LRKQRVRRRHDELEEPQFVLLHIDGASWRMLASIALEQPETSPSAAD
jgi:hypothetical protein